MGKYVIKRLLHGLFSVICVVLLVMLLVYSLMDRTKIFASDGNYTKLMSNAKTVYAQSRWEAYGYLDYVPYGDYINELARNGEIDEETRAEAVAFGRTPDKDSAVTAEYVAKFTEYYESQGYDVIRLDAETKRNGQLKDGGNQALYATRDVPLVNRLWNYFTGMIFFDNIHYVPEETDIGERGLTFTLHDPL